MLQLPGNCRAGKFSVFPSNWKTVRANVNLTWKIKYRFYDDNTGKVKQVVIKGMNKYKTLAEKREHTKAILEDELDLLTNKGVNRITDEFKSNGEESDISRDAPFHDALDFAFERVKAGKETVANIKSILVYVKKASESLKYDRLSISQIKVKHLTLLLEKCGELKKKSVIVVSEKKGKTKKGLWTANTFNQYRAHLGMLFKILKKMEAVDANYPLELDKENAVRKIRATLTLDQRKEVNDIIYNKDRNFWRFLHVFYASGCREVELLSVKAKDVDIEGQRFKVLVKKGRQYSEQWRTIKTIVLHLWQELISEAKQEDYLFNVGLRPGGLKPIRRDQITRRWLNHVKKPLGITADIYSFKHSHTTEVVDLLDEQKAAKHNGHTTTKMVAEVYDIKSKGRKIDQVRELENKFA